MITNIIVKLINGTDLKFSEVKDVIDQMTEGKVSDIQMAAFLTALRIKGETVEEITAAAQTIKNKSVPFNLDVQDAIDIVGTGGDCCGTFNISTAAAFIAAAAGCNVTKHGNRSASSKSGAADVLESLGANINLKPENTLQILRKIGICFLFAQNYNPCMRHVANVRQKIGTRTVFNILGPLVNPARAKMQLIGVYDKKLTEPLAYVLKNLSITDGMTIHGADGLDEATITDETIISEIRNSKITTYTIKPEDFGLKRAVLADIQGGTPKDNGQIILNLFSGKEKGAKLDIAILNAALLIYITRKTANVKDGVELARKAVDSGNALKILNDFIELSNSFNE